MVVSSKITASFGVDSSISKYMIPATLLQSVKTAFLMMRCGSESEVSCSFKITPEQDSLVILTKVFASPVLLITN